MAFAAARPTFSFHLHASLSSPRTSGINLIIPKPSLLSTTSRLQFTTSSMDVSNKQHTSMSEPEPESTPIENMRKFDRRHLEERFAVLNTDIHECRSCGYLYDKSAGDTLYPIPPGLSFDELPVDWRCPTCGAAQCFFQTKSAEIGVFAQHHQFGLGTNSLTIPPELLFMYAYFVAFFALFFCGYFLQ